uniref:Interleukin 18 receptor accessory protein n=1 Tax=Gopherus evgoodei TaxID=1825980 RepID=A0A8C4YIU0_9SAUR
MSDCTDMFVACLSECLHKEPERIYHAITDEEFILECVLPSQHRTHMYNNSFLYKNKVLWFWQQKDGEPLKIISSESTNPTQEGNALWFRPIGINASGVYICTIRYVKWPSKISCLSNVIKVQAKNNTNCLDNGRNELSLLIEKGHSISCPGIHCYNHLQRSPVTWYKVTVALFQFLFFGFESDFLPMITWYRDNKESKKLEGKSFVHVATLREVTERDLNSNFICFAQNSVGNSTGVLKLKRKERGKSREGLAIPHNERFLVGLLVGSAFVYQHWIEIVLMYRNYLAKGRNYRGDSTFLNEEQFALEVLPEVLENKYGYKLCLLERDILPGGAYTDDIVTAIQQSRRAIIILSPGYVNGPSIFELQAAVNCALEDNMLKLILIKYKSFQEPASLPAIVKKALKILPVVTWKSSNSNSPNKQFWKYMRYHMPVKNIGGLEKNSLKFFFHRLFSMVINSRKATGRSQQTKK